MQNDEHSIKEEKLWYWLKKARKTIQNNRYWGYKFRFKLVCTIVKNTWNSKAHGCPFLKFHIWPQNNEMSSPINEMCFPYQRDVTPCCWPKTNPKKILNDLEEATSLWPSHQPLWWLCWFVLSYVRMTLLFYKFLFLFHIESNIYCYLF